MLQSDIEDDEHLGQYPETKERKAKAENFNNDRLRSYIERIERLKAEKKNLGSDITDIFTEAKSSGYDPKVMRALIKEREQEPAAVEELETMLDLYRRAVG